MKNQNDSQKKPSRRKYIIAAVIILCILAGYIYKVVTWTPIDSDAQKASEAIIRQAVAIQLNKDPNKLTDNDFAQITKLDLGTGQRVGRVILYRKPGQELTDIRILEKFTNLQELNLSSIKYPDKNIPKWMTILVKFGIYDVEKRFAINLNPLTNLSALKSLRLSNSQIYDLTPIKKLINLQELHIDRTLVSDLEPVMALKNLQKL